MPAYIRPGERASSSSVCEWVTSTTHLVNARRWRRQDGKDRQTERVTLQSGPCNLFFPLFASFPFVNSSLSLSLSPYLFPSIIMLKVDGGPPTSSAYSLSPTHKHCERCVRYSSSSSSSKGYTDKPHNTLFFLVSHNRLFPPTSQSGNRAPHPRALLCRRLLHLVNSAHVKSLRQP